MKRLNIHSFRGLWNEFGEIATREILGKGRDRAAYGGDYVWVIQSVLI